MSFGIEISQCVFGWKKMNNEILLGVFQVYLQNMTLHQLRALIVYVYLENIQLPFSKYSRTCTLGF